MNRKFIYTCLLIAAVTSGCKKDEAIKDEGKTPVTFRIDGNVTRTVTDGSQTTFVEGDVLGITSSGLDADMANAEYTVCADGTLAGEVFYYNGSSSATFYAHYPYTAEYKDGAVTMTVEGDQSTAERYNASDFMTAIATGDPVSGGNVSLKMYHRLTLVKINWNGSLNATEATLHDVIKDVTWIHADNSLKLGTTVSDILTWKVYDDRQEYWAVIPAQTVAAGSTLLSIFDPDKTFKYVTQSEITFNPNTIKSITLDVKPDGAVAARFSDIEIENWQNDDLICEGTVDEYEVPAVELITVEAGRNITLTPNTKNNAEAGKWNVANKSAADAQTPNIIEWSETEGGIHMNVASGNWWDNAVYFRPDAATAAKIRPTLYKLSFDAKASEISKGFMIQVMKGDESANTYFGIINSDPVGKEEVTYNRMYYPSFKTAGEYVTHTYWVNFGKIINAAGDNVTEGTVGDYDKVLLTLSINTGTSAANAYGVDFHFRNFTFTEVK